MIVLNLCAQLAVLYTYNCLLILIYYRLGQNQLIINKYAERSRYSLWPIKLGLAYIITLYAITSLGLTLFLTIFNFLKVSRSEKLHYFDFDVITHLKTKQFRNHNGKISLIVHCT